MQGPQLRRPARPGVDPPVRQHRHDGGSISPWSADPEFAPTCKRCHVRDERRQEGDRSHAASPGTARPAQPRPVRRLRPSPGQLREDLGPGTPATIAFDRGGSYPAVFTASARPDTTGTATGAPRLPPPRPSGSRPPSAATEKTLPSPTSTKPSRSRTTVRPGSSPSSTTTAPRCCRSSPPTPRPTRPH
jgi:hypothetical protein